MFHGFLIPFTWVFHGPGPFNFAGDVKYSFNINGEKSTGSVIAIRLCSTSDNSGIFIIYIQ